MDFRSVVASSKGLTESDPACVAVIDNSIYTLIVFDQLCILKK